MFEAVFPQGLLLKRMVDCLSPLCESVNCRVDEAGLVVQAFDPSKVAMCDLLLRSDGFEHFRCDRPLTLGLPLKQMEKLLKVVSSQDKVALRSHDSQDELIMTVTAEGGGREGEFAIRLMQLEDEETLSMPDTDWGATVRMSSPELMRVIRDLGSISGDILYITATKEAISFRVYGDAGTATTTYRAGLSGQVAGSRKKKKDADDDGDLVIIEAEAPETNVSFGMRCLLPIVKSAVLAPATTIHLGQDLPMALVFPIADMGHLSWFVQSRFAEDDNDDGGGNYAAAPAGDADAGAADF